MYFYFVFNHEPANSNSKKIYENENELRVYLLLLLLLLLFLVVTTIAIFIRILHSLLVVRAEGSFEFEWWKRWNRVQKKKFMALQFLEWFNGIILKSFTFVLAVLSTPLHSLSVIWKVKRTPKEAAAMTMGRGVEFLLFKCISLWNNFNMKYSSSQLWNRFVHSLYSYFILLCASVIQFFFIVFIHF